MKELRSLLSGKGIKKSGHALISGRKTVPEVLEKHKEWVRCIVYGNGVTDRNIIKNDGTHEEIALAKPLFNELDVHGSGFPLLDVTVPDICDIDRNILRGISIAVPFQDPANVGAVIRSAAAFGVNDVIILDEAAHPFHPKSVRAGGSALFSVKYFKGPSISDINTTALPCAALTLDGIPLHDFSFPKQCIILPGIEGPGIPDTIDPEYKITIPISSEIESLNAAVAVSVVLYEYTRNTGSH